MIKIIIFDLDGVLIDSNYMHYETFMYAIQSVNKSINYSFDQHNILFNSLTTKKKVEKLVELNLLNSNDFDIIYDRKQEYTRLFLNNITKNQILITMIETLRKKYRLFCCSNSNKINIEIILTKLGIFEYFEKIYGNNDVIHPKPSPEIYDKAIKNANVLPNEVLILEDSDIGLKAAYDSKAHVLEVKKLSDVNYENIINTINKLVYH